MLAEPMAGREYPPPPCIWDRGAAPTRPQIDSVPRYHQMTVRISTAGKSE